MSGDGLEAVLTAHTPVIGGVRTCRCGHGHDEDWGLSEGDHAAHLADQIRAWIADQYPAAMRDHPGVNP